MYNLYDNPKIKIISIVGGSGNGLDPKKDIQAA